MFQKMLLVFCGMVLTVSSISQAGPFGWRRGSRPAVGSTPSATIQDGRSYLWPSGTYTFENMACDHGMSCVGGTFGGSTCQWQFEFYGKNGMRLNIINENGDVSRLRTFYRVREPNYDGRVDVEIPCFSDAKAMIALQWSPREDRCFNARLVSE